MPWPRDSVSGSQKIGLGITSAFKVNIRCWGQLIPLRHSLPNFSCLRKGHTWTRRMTLSEHQSSNIQFFGHALLNPVLHVVLLFLVHQRARLQLHPADLKVSAQTPLYLSPKHRLPSTVQEYPQKYSGGDIFRRFDYSAIEVPKSPLLICARNFRLQNQGILTLA